MIAVSVRVPGEEVRVPVDICCVIDISGSMGQSATPANEEEGAQASETGLSVLDIVKHAVKTVMCVLKDGDRMALVAFDDKAETVFPLKEMSAEGRAQAMDALSSLRPRGQTNLWDGVHAGMETLREQTPKRAGRRKTLLVLTDGQPNIAPPRGHLSELKLYKDSHRDFQFQINTFGFGYDLDSELLLDLATEGNGTYAFIPDAVIVGTTFVNSVANVLSTWAQSTQLHLMLHNSAEFTGAVLGKYQATDTSWGRVVALGPLQLGQSREVVVPMSLPAGMEPYLEVVFTYAIPGAAEGRTSVQVASRSASVDALMAELRCRAVQAGFDSVTEAAAGHGKAAQEALTALASHLAMSAATCDDERLSALRADIDGRMSKALKGKERFNRWGKHYLRALVRAHQLQLCTNFMDPGVQVYGGSLFRSLRAEGDAAFLSLPAPRPAKDETVMPCDACGQMVAFCDYGEHARVCRTGQTRPAAPARQPSPPPRMRQRTPSPVMRTYYAGSGGGCFGAGSIVSVVTRSGEEVQKAVDKVRAGDWVRVSDGGAAQVCCVLQIARQLEKKLIALPGGLMITPRHPIRRAGKWQLPAALGRATESHCGHVYNFVLDRCHVLLVNGVECVTWAHGFEGEVVGHPYYSNERVVADLARMSGWEQGLVQVEGCVRKGASRQVVGLLGKLGIPRTLAVLSFSSNGALQLPVDDQVENTARDLQHWPSPWGKALQDGPLPNVTAF